MSDQLLIKRLKHKYGEFSPIRLTGGYTNETFLLEGTNPPLVAKVSNGYNQDIENEINSLKLTQKTGKVPKLFEAFQINNHHITVINYCEGENAQSILDQNDINRTKEIYILLGKTLAKDIHFQKYSFISLGVRECNISELPLELDFVPLELSRRSKEIISNINDVQKNWVLTHGDYGVHNVLFNPKSGLTVLDWEWSEWANPLADIAWVCWFTSLHYPEHATKLNRLFIEAYSIVNPIAFSPEKLKGYAVYKVWKVLNKLKHASVEVKEEWVRRLKWTIETDIFDFIA